MTPLRGIDQDHQSWQKKQLQHLCPQKTYGFYSMVSVFIGSSYGFYMFLLVDHIFLTLW